MYNEENIDITPLIKANNFLKEAIEKAQTSLEKTGAVFSFVYCVELSWKIMQKILKSTGYMEVPHNPKAVLRLAAANYLIDDLAVWFSFLEKRNLSVHTYNEDVLEQVFSILPLFESKLSDFITKVKR